MTETKPTYGQPQPVTAAELDEWQALCDRATPPEWFTAQTEEGDYGVYGPDDGDSETFVGWVASKWDNRSADARFIVAFRTAGPRLIAEVRRLQVALAQAEQRAEQIDEAFWEHQFAESSEEIRARMKRGARRTSGRIVPPEADEAQAREPGPAPEVW